MSDPAKLRAMVLQTHPVGEPGAPLFPAQKQRAMLDLLDWADDEECPDRPRVLAQVEGALWAIGIYSLEEMEA